MNATEFKEWAESIESIVKTIGVVIGAVWIYLKFIRTRENHPKIQFEVDLRVLGKQDSKIIIEVIATIENKGLVRHYINDLSCDILTLKKGMPVVYGDERINYQVMLEKYNPTTDKGRIVWIPKDWYYSFVDAGIKQSYTYLSAIPEDTMLVSIYAHFHFKNRKDDFQTAQRAFPIPS